MHERVRDSSSTGSSLTIDIYCGKGGRDLAARGRSRSQSDTPSAIALLPLALDLADLSFGQDDETVTDPPDR